MNVPTLDLSKFISGIDEERKAFSDDLGHSFNQTGFAIIKNHGLKKELTDELYKVIKAFFDLEDEKKIKYYFPDLYGQRGDVVKGQEHAKGSKKGDLKELLVRIDIIPTSIALAQAAKESGWGTSRFALEGNAIFGQWTWSGQGIAPLDRASNKNHKILKFPILRASVKAYQNNLNTHKSYAKFRQKRLSLRDKKNKISGLELTETLNNYAQTGSEYTKILNQIIKQNRLTDFEPVRLVNSVKKIELTS